MSIFQNGISMNDYTLGSKIETKCNQLPCEVVESQLKFKPWKQRVKKKYV